MPFIGTIINFLCIVVFSVAGMLVGTRIPERVNRSIFNALAICLIFTGLESALQPTTEACLDTFFGNASLTKFIIIILSMVIGTVIGESIDIDKWVNKFGEKLELKLNKNPDKGTGNFAKGFVQNSILTCVGAMAVNGAILDAVGDPSVLIAKSVIDAVSSFILAASLGIGCAFSAVPMLIYQGTLTGLVLLMSAVIPEACIYYLSATGSLIMVLIGTNFIGATNVKTANMIPAVFIPMILVPLFCLF